MSVFAMFAMETIQEKYLWSLPLAQSRPKPKRRPKKNPNRQRRKASRRR